MQVLTLLLVLQVFFKLHCGSTCYHLHHQVPMKSRSNWDQVPPSSPNQVQIKFHVLHIFAQQRVDSPKSVCGTFYDRLDGTEYGRALGPGPAPCPAWARPGLGPAVPGLGSWTETQSLRAGLFRPAQSPWTGQGQGPPGPPAAAIE